MSHSRDIRVFAGHREFEERYRFRRQHNQRFHTSRLFPVQGQGGEAEATRWTPRLTHQDRFESSEGLQTRRYLLRHVERILSVCCQTGLYLFMTTVPAGKPSAEWFDRLPPRQPADLIAGPGACLLVTECAGETIPLAVYVQNEYFTTASAYTCARRSSGLSFVSQEISR